MKTLEETQAHKDITELEKLQTDLFELLSENGSIQNKGLSGPEYIKAYNLIYKVQEIDTVYKDRISKYDDVINHGFFTKDEKVFFPNKMFDLDNTRHFELLETTLTETGFSKKNKLNSRILYDNSIPHDSNSFENYFKYVKNNINKYCEFMSNIQKRIGDYIMFPEENLDPKKGNLIFAIRNNNYLEYYNITYNEEDNCLEGYRVTYDIYENSLFKSKYKAVLKGEIKYDKLEDKIKVAYPEFFL